jgi:hypothetical protein
MLPEFMNYGHEEQAAKAQLLHAELMAVPGYDGWRPRSPGACLGEHCLGLQ